MKINFSFCWLFAAASLLRAESVVAPGAKLEKLAGDFAFTEGATCDKNGNVFFIDQPNDRIMEWSVDGKLSTFLQPSGYANGMMFDANGNLIACADEHNQLWSIAPDKTVAILVTNYRRQISQRPERCLDRAQWRDVYHRPVLPPEMVDHTTMALPSEEVFYLSPDRKTLTQVTEDLKKPNGITGTPDGKNLYVSDIRAGQTWRYDILPDGSLTNKTLFCGIGSDGMTIDDEGDLYLTGHGVSIFDKTGKQIDHIDVHEKWTGNVCFGGKDRKTLFIAASTSLYSIRMNVKGANPAK